MKVQDAREKSLFLKGKWRIPIDTNYITRQEVVK